MLPQPESFNSQQPIDGVLLACERGNLNSLITNVSLLIQTRGHHQRGIEKRLSKLGQDPFFRFELHKKITRDLGSPLNGEDLTHDLAVAAVFGMKGIVKKFQNPETQKAVLGYLQQADQNGKRGAVIEGLFVAKAFGLGENPQSLTVLKQLAEKNQLYLKNLEDKRPQQPLRRHLLFRTFPGALAAGFTLGAGLNLGPRVALSTLRRLRPLKVTFDRDKLFTPPTPQTKKTASPPNSPSVQPPPSPSAEAMPSKTTAPPATEEPNTTPAPPTEEPTPPPESSPSPTDEPPTVTPEPTISPEEEVGTTNLAEHFLKDLVQAFKEVRAYKYANDPYFRQRIKGLETVNEEEREALAQEILNRDRINLLFLGLDQTRKRHREFNDQGWGRSDVMMLISFDPHTFKTIAISFPRDLFAPELTRFGFSKINSLTMAPVVRPGTDSNDLARRIIESATGIPIDMVVKTNIDFMEGFADGEGNFHPGIFDALFPDKLEIDVPERLVDRAYPVGYGTKTVVFEKGPQLMDGQQLTEYARSRHSDSDFGRAGRQRQVLLASLKKFFFWATKDCFQGNTTTLDTLLESLYQQRGKSNLFSDANIWEYLEVIKEGVKNLSGNPRGLSILATLAANSKDEVGDFIFNPEAFSSLGLSRENGWVVNASFGETRDSAYLLKIAGSSISSPPTELDQYLNYWHKLREEVRARYLE